MNFYHVGLHLVCHFPKDGHTTVLEMNKITIATYGFCEVKHFAALKKRGLP